MTPARRRPSQSPGSCSIPASAQAYSLNFTAVPKGPLSYLTTWPTGQAQPLASTLNASTGAVTANAAIVPAGTGGSVSVFSSDATDLVIDVDGYFAAPGSGGLSLYTLTPCRVLDTRNPPGLAALQRDHRGERCRKWVRRAFRGPSVCSECDGRYHPRR